MKIHTLDLQFKGFPQCIASYLLEGPTGWVLVETGPMSTLSRLQEALVGHGITPADVQHVLVTHIHLDHAGAAGWWAQQGAQVYVHRVGAPHLIDPSKLWQSASRIYGDQMEPLWGNILPAPAGQITALRDGDVIDVAGLSLTALDTPGHAWHHHVFRLDDVAFTGDAAGVRIFAGDWVSLPAPPPEFNLDVWHRTLDRLEAEQFQALYLTHFGRVEDVSYQLEQLRTTMEAAVGYIRKEMEAGMARDALIKSYVEWNREQALNAGIAPEDYEKYEAANPLYMSVDGIMRYWRKQWEETTS